MEMFGKTLCVTFEELVGGGIMSLANYKSMFVRRSSILCSMVVMDVKHLSCTNACLTNFASN